jgi:hypothetical protein
MVMIISEAAFQKHCNCRLREIKRPRGLKPAILAALNAALKGRSSTVAHSFVRCIGNL